MRLMGILPPNGTEALFAIVFTFNFFAATLGLSGFIVVTSMMADVVEDAAVATGQRSEGLLFAANGLISKCVTGVGTFLSGLMLLWVSFPQHATPGQVDPAILHRLGMVFVPIVVRTFRRLRSVQSCSFIKNLKNPYFLGDEPGLTESTGCGR